MDLPQNAKPNGCRWVYKIKHHGDDTIERFKARLVSKGYNYIKGLDYFETYSLVAKLTILRIVVALVSINSCHLHQLDIKNAFLHGELQEDMYMTTLPSVKHAKHKKVCKLVKVGCEYGSKKLPRGGGVNIPK